MKPYASPLWIVENAGNNAFSFEKRPNPKLWIPSLTEGGLQDVQIGSETVFEDFDEHGALQSCIGLKNLVQMRHPKTDKPIYVVDNHNHVFYFWFESLLKGLIRKGSTLFHIDAHRDTRKPERNPNADELSNLESLFNYTQHILNVGNYIPPAMESGLVSKLISVTGEDEMDQNPPAPHPSLIVNVDLDFWAPEMMYIPEEKSLNYVRAWMEQADLITIATSPFFIDQARAIEKLKALFSVYFGGQDEKV